MTFVSLAYYGDQLFEPDKFERCSRHHVDALKHILHVLRPNKILYGLNFRRCQLPNNVYSVAVVAAA